MKPAFDPSKPFQVIEKPKFDPSKPFKATVFSEVEEKPKKKEEITPEMILDMIRSEIKRAISSQKIVERVIETKTVEKPAKETKITEKVIIDEETKAKIVKINEEIEKVKHSINFIIPARIRSKEHYEITDLDQRRRTFNAVSGTVDELYQVVGTLIADLKAAKILQ